MLGVAQWPSHRAPSVGTQRARGKGDKRKKAAVSMLGGAQWPSHRAPLVGTQLREAAVSLSQGAQWPSHRAPSVGTQHHIRVVEVTVQGVALHALSVAAALSMPGVAQWPSQSPPSVGKRILLLPLEHGRLIYGAPILVLLLDASSAPGQRPSPTSQSTRPHLPVYRLTQSQLARHHRPRRRDSRLRPRRRDTRLCRPRRRRPRPRHRRRRPRRRRPRRRPCRPRPRRRRPRPRRSRPRRRCPLTLTSPPALAPSIRVPQTAFARPTFRRRTAGPSRVRIAPSRRLRSPLERP